MLGFIILLLSSTAFAHRIPSDMIDPNIVNKIVDRHVDISTQTVHMQHIIILENKAKEPIKEFILVPEPGMEMNLAYIAVRRMSDTMSLNITEVDVDDDLSVWKVRLVALDSIEEAKISVETVYTQVLDPLPEEIKQCEKQLILYKGNLYFYSPYPTLQLTSKIVHGSKNVERYSVTEPVVVSEDYLMYGPFKNVSPFAIKNVSVHFESNTTFLVVTEMERTIGLSHWGNNIAVEDTITLQLKGARLKGGYSILNIQNTTAPFVMMLKTILPPLAKDIYYCDDIGNISTSVVQFFNEGTVLILRPRFPLFGGWRTKYTIGYNLPLEQYLFNEANEYLLVMPLVGHIYNGMVVEELTTKIILPEGSYRTSLLTPYVVERLPDSRHYSYLDTIGRPVISVKKTNVVRNHIQQFMLHYMWHSEFLIQEPFILIMSFFLLFLIVIISRRLEVDKAPKWLRLKDMHYYLDRILKLHSKRVSVYERFDIELHQLKYKKDVQRYQSKVRKIYEELKAVNEELNVLVAKLRFLPPNIVGKADDMQMFEKHLYKWYTQYEVLYMSFVNEKPSSRFKRERVFDFEEDHFRIQKHAYVEKINVCVKYLEKTLKDMYRK